MKKQGVAWITGVSIITRPVVAWDPATGALTFQKRWYDGLVGLGRKVKSRKWRVG